MGRDRTNRVKCTRRATRAGMQHSGSERAVRAPAKYRLAHSLYGFYLLCVCMCVCAPADAATHNRCIEITRKVFIGHGARMVTRQDGDQAGC